MSIKTDTRSLVEHMNEQTKTEETAGSLSANTGRLQEGKSG